MVRKASDVFKGKLKAAEVVVMFNNARITMAYHRIHAAGLLPFPEPRSRLETASSSRLAPNATNSALYRRSQKSRATHILRGITARPSQADPLVDALVVILQPQLITDRLCVTCKLRFISVPTIRSSNAFFDRLDLQTQCI